MASGCIERSHLPANCPCVLQVEGFLEELLVLCQRSEEYTQVGCGWGEMAFGVGFRGCWTSVNRRTCKHAKPSFPHAPPPPHSNPQYLLARMGEVCAPATLPPARETAMRGGAFNSAVRELLSYYISLEEYYMEESLAKVGRGAGSRVWGRRVGGWVGAGRMWGDAG